MLLLTYLTILTLSYISYIVNLYINNIFSIIYISIALK